MRDYIEEIVELVATRHRDGLRILSGEAAPPSREDLEENHTSQYGSGGIYRSHHPGSRERCRSPGGCVVVESVAPYVFGSSGGGVGCHSSRDQKFCSGFQGYVEGFCAVYHPGGKAWMDSPKRTDISNNNDKPENRGIGYKNDPEIQKGRSGENCMFGADAPEVFFSEFRFPELFPFYSRNVPEIFPFYSLRNLQIAIK